MEFAYANLDCFVGRFDPGDESPIDLSAIRINVVMSDLQGRQEDAEEYLGFILNGLHEEMLSLKKLLSPTHESKFFYVRLFARQLLVKDGACPCSLSHTHLKLHVHQQ